MQRVVLASGNQGKVREINQILYGLDLQVVPQTELGVDEVEETGLTFVENAIIKARAASQQTGLAAIADDSGLEVDALQGAPGIYSARYAGANASDAENYFKLLEAMDGVAEPQRKARFRCLMVYMRHAADPTPIICQGSWEGAITLAPHGENGFGYDPVFWVPEYSCSAAALSAGQKNNLSHRGAALRQLAQQLGAMGIGGQR